MTPGCSCESRPDRRSAGGTRVVLPAPGGATAQPPVLPEAGENLGQALIDRKRGHQRISAGARLFHFPSFALPIPVEIRKRNGPACRCDRNDVFFLLSHVVDRPGERSIPGIVSNHLGSAASTGWTPGSHHTTPSADPRRLFTRPNSVVRLCRGHCPALRPWMQVPVRQSFRASSATRSIDSNHQSVYYLIRRSCTSMFVSIHVSFHNFLQNTYCVAWKSSWGWPPFR